MSVFPSLEQWEYGHHGDLDHGWRKEGRGVIHCASSLCVTSLRTQDALDPILVSGICHHPVLSSPLRRSGEGLGAGLCLQGDCDDVPLGAIWKWTYLEG